jgi:hypothetical protein
MTGIQIDKGTNTGTGITRDINIFGNSIYGASEGMTLCGDNLKVRHNLIDNNHVGDSCIKARSPCRHD